MWEKTSAAGFLVGQGNILIDEDNLLNTSYGDNQKSGSKLANILHDYIVPGISLTLKTSLAYGTDILCQKLEYAKQNDFLVCMYYIAIDNPWEAAERIENRVQKGGRNVPMAEIVDSYRHRWERLSKLIPFCDQVTLFDNNNGFQKIGAYKENALTIYSQDIPMWMQEFIQYFGAEPTILTKEEW